MNISNLNLTFGQKPTNSKFIDIEGQKFNYLLVLGFKESKPNSFQMWYCLCDCGNTTVVESYRLRTGHTKSCGCFQKLNAVILGKKSRKHGKEGTRIYRIWTSMLQRCFNPSTIGWHRYGGRNITVCDGWLTFEGFYQDMGDPPSNTHTLDRENNDGNYEPTNCRWATVEQQSNNRVSNRFLTYNGKTQTVMQWARELNLDYRPMYRKLAKGYSVEEILYAK